MGKFIVGIIFTLVVLALGAFIYLNYGFVNLQADQPISLVEKLFLGKAMDRSTERHAPKANNPFPPSDENLIAGIRVYKNNCVVCHGGADLPTSPVGQGLFPPSPQFLKDAPDMPQNQNYWIIKHGVKNTGMPAWEKALSDKQIWQVVTFLSKFEDLEKLSPAVQQEWKGGGQAELGAEQKSTTPAPAMPEHKEGHDHHHD